MKLTFHHMGPRTGPYVKMIEEDPNARPRGRSRVKIFDEATNKLVTYPSGRVRWFASEAAADEWIRIANAVKTLRASGENFTKSFRPRNYARRT